MSFPSYRHYRYCNPRPRATRQVKLYHDRPQAWLDVALYVAYMNYVWSRPSGWGLTGE